MTTERRERRRPTRTQLITALATAVVLVLLVTLTKDGSPLRWAGLAVAASGVCLLWALEAWT